jgi:hypothetical protein
MHYKVLTYHSGIGFAIVHPRYFRHSARRVDADALLIFVAQINLFISLLTDSPINIPKLYKKGKEINSIKSSGRQRNTNSRIHSKMSFESFDI